MKFYQPLPTYHTAQKVKQPIDENMKLLPEKFQVEQLSYYYQKLKHFSANKSFVSLFPDFVLPPDELLFETGQINYHWYRQSGNEAAAEFASYFSYFHPAPAQKIMDWGCGAGRVTRHLPAYFPAASITGVDINPTSVEWLQNKMPGIHFKLGHALNEDDPGRYDLIIGISVLTHLPVESQLPSLETIAQLLQVGGLAFISTRGRAYEKELSRQAHNQLLNDGLLTTGGKKAGSRAMRTYHTPDGFRALLQRYFSVLMYYEGRQFSGVLGGQDLWLLKKTAQPTL